MVDRRFRVRCRTRVASRVEGDAYPGLRDALVLVAPDDQVQEVRQVLLPDRVLGAGRVLQPVLMQHEDVEPLGLRVRRAVRRPHPAGSNSCIIR